MVIFTSEERKGLLTSRPEKTISAIAAAGREAMALPNHDPRKAMESMLGLVALCAGIATSWEKLAEARSLVGMADLIELVKEKPTGEVFMPVFEFFIEHSAKLREEPITDELITEAVGMIRYAHGCLAREVEGRILALAADKVVK